MQTSDRSFYARTFVLVALAIVGYLIYQVLAPFAQPIAWALVIALLIQPLHRWLTRLLPIPGWCFLNLLTFRKP